MVIHIANIDKFSNAVNLIRGALWNYKYKLAFTLALGFLAGLFGGIGIGALIPLFAIVTNNKTVEIDFITKTIQRFFSIIHVEYNIFFILAFIIAVFILKALITYFTFYFTQKLHTGYEKQLRTELFKATIKADWPYLLEQKIGYLETVLIQDISGSAGVLAGLNTLIVASTSIIMYALVAINISATITLITFGVGLMIFFFLKPLFYKSRKISVEMSEISKRATHHISEHTIGAKTVKTMGAEDQVLGASNKFFEDYKQICIKRDLYNRIPGAFFEPISLIFISLIFLFFYYHENSLGIGAFATIVYLIQKEFTFMQSIQNSLSSINQSLPQLKIVTDYKQNALNHREVDPGSAPFKFEDKIEFKNVSFAYNTEGKILSNLNLTIHRGEMVGLIGPSGAGKTTFVDIILGLFPIGSGEILLDGEDISKTSKKSWRNNIGYVSQDTFLLNNTIENNIRFYDNRISSEDIIRATKLANIYDFIEQLPNGLSTLVGERGVKLSGGQKQRIILARVIAKNPKILILDEATSALDNESELLIQNAIEELKGKTTILVIAHRLSTIINSDRLIALENGKITEQGKPSELLKDKDSYYYKIYNIREK